MLTLASVFTSVEFYVIISVVAAAVVALSSMPERKGEVKQYLVAGTLSMSSDEDYSVEEAVAGKGRIVFEVHEGNLVTLRRFGLSGVWSGDAVSLSVKVSGFDVMIEERVSTGRNRVCGGLADEASFLLEFFAPEWYHIRYESERFNEHASLTLHVREGIRMEKNLIR